VRRSLRRVRILRRLAEAGFTEVLQTTLSDLSDSPDVISGQVAHHPLPEEVWEVFSCAGMFTLSVKRVGRGYQVFIHDDIGVYVEGGEPEPLLTRPVRMVWIEYERFEVVSRDEMERVERYFREHAMRYRIPYSQLIPLDYDEYYLTQGQPIVAELLPLERVMMRRLIGRDVYVRSPLPINMNKADMVDITDHVEYILGHTARILRHLGRVIVVGEGGLRGLSLDSSGFFGEPATAFSLDLLAAYRVLEREGFSPSVATPYSPSNLIPFKTLLLRFYRNNPPIPRPFNGESPSYHVRACIRRLSL
jgi:hypothetical protein